jgi:hypothetical protein
MTALLRENAYLAWKDGDATATEALRSLCADYEELDNTYRQFEGIRDQTRNQISEVVATCDGEKAEIAGFGVVRLTQASVTLRYDGEALDKLATDLAGLGLIDLADRILGCKKPSARAGSLRIEREKAPRGT